MEWAQVEGPVTALLISRLLRKKGKT
eukprot:COSAG01_NODE_52011_length_350_cov_0.573705_1_plen_25_part_10